MISRIHLLAAMPRSAATIGVVLVVVALSGCAPAKPFLLDDATDQVDAWVELALSRVSTNGSAEVDDHSSCRPTDADSTFGGQDAADAGELLAVRSTTTIPVGEDGQDVVDAITAAIDDDGWTVVTPPAPSVLRATADPPDATAGGYLEVIEFDPGTGIGGRVILNVTSRCYLLNGVSTDDD